LDKSWRVVVSGMAEARSHEAHPDPVGMHYDFSKAGTYSQSPPIMAIKEVGGKGRLAISSVYAMYTMWNVGCPILDDIVLEKGDGYRKSDMKKLLFNTFRWLVEPAMKSKNLGGFIPVTKEERLKAAVGNNSTPWVLLGDRGKPMGWDDLKSPEPHKRIYKGVIGAHSSLTDGKTDVAGYSQAAKAQGLSYIVFTEPLPLMGKEKWETLKAECAKASDAEFLAIPGLEFKDLVGTVLLRWNMKEFPLEKNITEKGDLKAPVDYDFQIGRNASAALCMADTQKKNGIDPHHYWHISHTAVFSYERDKMIDDSTAHYAHSESVNWCNVPITFTRIYSAEDMKAIPMGNYVQADSMSQVKDIVTSTIIRDYDGWPQQAFISGGPMITQWDIINHLGVYPAGPGKERYRIFLKASSEKGLKEVKIIDTQTRAVFRRFLPNGEKQFTVEIDGYHYKQPYLIAYVTDVDNKIAISSCIRTKLERNWSHAFGDLQYCGMTYTGYINNEGWWLQQPTPAPYYTLHTGGEIGARGMKAVKRDYVIGMDGMAYYPGLMEGNPLLLDFASDYPDWVTYHEITSTDVAIGHCTSTRKISRDQGQHNTLPHPRVSKETEYIEVIGRTIGERPRPYSKISLPMTDVDITFKKDVKIEAPTLVEIANVRKNQNSTIGEWDNIVVADKQYGSLAYNVKPGEQFSRKGKLATGGYVNIYPQRTAGTVTFIWLGEQDLAYELFGNGENLRFKLSLELAQGKEFHAGDHIRYKFLAGGADTSIQTGNEWIEKFLSQFGIKGKLPYTISITRGKEKEFKSMLTLSSDAGACLLKIEKAELLQDIPVAVEGLASNAPAGVYDIKTAEFRHIAVDAGGVGYLIVDNSESDKDLFVGNLLTCSRKEMIFNVVSSGKGEADIEAHNPTDTEITCDIAGDKDFPPLAVFSAKQVKVAPGASVHVKTQMSREWVYKE